MDGFKKILTVFMNTPFYAIGSGFLLSYFSGNMKYVTLLGNIINIGMSIFAFGVCLIGMYFLNIKFKLTKGENFKHKHFTIAPALLLSSVAYVQGCNGGRWFNVLCIVLGITGTGFAILLHIVSLAGKNRKGRYRNSDLCSNSLESLNQVSSSLQSEEEQIRAVGEEGEKRVQFGLKMLQDFDEYKTYNDFYIVADNGFKQQIDHMAVGKNGVFLLETKTFKGEYEIKPDGSWYKHYHESVTSVDNPTSQMERHELVLQSVLKDVLPEGVRIQHVLTIGTENVKDILLKGKEYCKYPVVHHKDITSYIRNHSTQRELTLREIQMIHQKIMKHLRNEKWKPKEQK